MASKTGNMPDQADQPRRSVIERWRENGAWKATEPRSDADLVGRGETELAAVKHYIELLEESEPA